MTSLVEENKTLMATFADLEKGIRRAQRERDLKETNVFDLEFQKNSLAEQSKTISDQKKGIERPRVEELICRNIA